MRGGGETGLELFDHKFCPKACWEGEGGGETGVEQFFTHFATGGTRRGWQASMAGTGKGKLG